MWPPRQRMPRDPNSPELVFLVLLVVFCLVSFYGAGAFSVYRSQKPFYAGLAAAFCDPGTGRARFIWFPPQYSFYGKYHGRPVYFMTASAGRRMHTHLMIGLPIARDLKITRDNFRSLPLELQRLLLPLARHPAFDFLTCRTGRVSFHTIFDGRPLLFGFGPGIHSAMVTPDFSLPGLRVEADVLMRAAENPLI